MDHVGIERRRVPRAEAAHDCRVSVHGSVTVRVLDFSESGVMVASKFQLAPGEQADLAVAVHEESVRVPIEIRHVSRQHVAGAGERYCAGAAVLEPGVEPRHRLNTILRAERG